MRTSTLFLCAALVGVAATLALAAERVSLFDGKTLKGWTVLTCEAEADNGEIFLKAGNGMVQTEKKYGDFIFECEFKALKAEKFDSGVYFRYDSIPPKRSWPARYQVNLKQSDMCNVGGLKGAKGEDLTKRGEWNSLKLTVRGIKAELEVNGKPMWKADGLEGPKEGFIGLQAEVPAGGQYRFRNIFITELK
jgi:hypothetical protein